MANIAKCPPLTRSSVQAAHELIKPYIHETPVLTCQTLNDLASTPQSPEALIGTPFEGHPPAKPKIFFFFKCENFQRIGAFKIRGASHALERLSKEELKHGVVTHSSGTFPSTFLPPSHHPSPIPTVFPTDLFPSLGNHAQALALAARTRHVRAHIVMPSISTPSKIAATKSYGADVIFSGSTSEEREAVVADVIKRTGARLVPPYDHPDIILGQGTMALELERQVADMVRREPGLSVHGQKESKPQTKGQEHPHEREDGTPFTDGDGYVASPPTTQERPHKTNEPGILDAVLAPCGGGGMLAGIATALAPTRTAVFGAEPSFQGADDARRGLLAGARVPSVSTLTIADGLRTPLGEIPWRVISDGAKVRGVYAVDEGQIRRAMRLVLERMKVVVEPSAVVGLAVGLWDEGFRGVVEREGGERGWDVGVVLSGGNTTVEAVGRLFGGEGEGEGKGERETGRVGRDGGRVAENVAG
ncbi:hypothetical protein MMC13_000321 [Lambiella insularis]|nr:hypothetical protein [Lambiella insularis]